MEYPVQEYADVSQKDVKMFCKTTQFPSLSFYSPHTKPHGVRGLINQYHIQFYIKLGHGICTIHCISYSCTECTYMLEKPWVHSFPPHQQPRYQPVID